MSPLQRRKKQCPLCFKSFFNIPRHLRSRHKYGDDEVKMAIGRHSEKLHFLPPGKLNAYGRCSLCFGKVACRLGRHLTRCHSLHKNDEQYKRIMRESLKERANRTLEQKQEKEEEKDDLEEKEEGEKAGKNVEEKGEKGEKGKGIYERKGANLYTYLGRFSEWLLDVDGGKHTQRGAEQHRLQVKNILSSICQNLHEDHVEGDGPREVDFTHENLKHKWFLLPNSLSPSTTRCYLHSLSKFLNFLQRAPVRIRLPIERLKCLKYYCTQWSLSLKKAVHLRKVAILRRDTARNCSREITEYYSSSHCRDMRRILRSLRSLRSGDVTVTKITEMKKATKSTRIRNHLLLMILLSNAQRPLPVISMTLRDLEDATVVKEEEGDDSKPSSYVIRVANHKTMLTCGDVLLYLSRGLYRDLVTYVDYFRTSNNSTSSSNSSNSSSSSSSSPEDPVFLTKGGYGMSTPLLGLALNSAWRKAGCKGDVSATLIRKTVITKIHNTNPELRYKLAKHMSHSVKTAEQYYAFNAGPQEACFMGAIIEKSF